MMNSKGFFFFKFDSRAGLEAVLEGGIPWLISKSLIILKKWSMDTRLLKEEIAPSMCNDSWGRSSFARCLNKVNFMRRELSWMLLLLVFHLFLRMILPKKPSVLSMNGGRPDVIHKKRKGKSKSTNGGQFTGPSVKHNVRYEPKATTSAPKKGTTYVGYTSQSTPMLKTTGNSSKKDNLSMSNSFSALNEEEEEDEEDVENVYDELANLIQNTKAGGSSSFTDAVDYDSATYSEGDIEAERNKALRKLSTKERSIEGMTSKGNFHLGKKIASKEVIKKMLSKLDVDERRQLNLDSYDKTSKGYS
ncbi:hypothetical protein Tco_0764729 [Tanacetum coccineum]